MRYGLILFLLIFSVNGLAETRKYVSDSLKIPARTGASTKHKILRFLESGTQVIVLEEDKVSGYSHVRLANGFEGWVLSSELMARPDARQQLSNEQERTRKLKERLKTLNEQFEALKQRSDEQDRMIGELNDQKTSLEADFGKLQQTAARPVQLARENEALKQDQSAKAQQIDELSTEVNLLQNNMKQRWFLIGGGVAIGSLVLGLIVTRIPWRRRKDDWGGY
jgi:SH3 domain protein